MMKHLDSTKERPRSTIHCYHHIISATIPNPTRAIISLPRSPCSNLHNSLDSEIPQILAQSKKYPLEEAKSSAVGHRDFKINYHKEQVNSNTLKVPKSKCSSSYQSRRKTIIIKEGLCQLPNLKIDQTSMNYQDEPALKPPQKPQQTQNFENIHNFYQGKPEDIKKKELNGRRMFQFFRPTLSVSLHNTPQFSEKKTNTSNYLNNINNLNAQKQKRVSLIKTPSSKHEEIAVSILSPRKIMDQVPDRMKPNNKIQKAKETSFAFTTLSSWASNAKILGLSANSNDDQSNLYSSVLETKTCKRRSPKRYLHHISSSFDQSVKRNTDLKAETSTFEGSTDLEELDFEPIKEPPSRNFVERQNDIKKHYSRLNHLPSRSCTRPQTQFNNSSLLEKTQKQLNETQWNISREFEILPWEQSDESP